MKQENKFREHIFVFGSNLAGRHGRGAALFAKNNYGAVYGVGVGRTGSAYGIPTKDINISTLPIDEIKKYVDDFVLYAKNNPDIYFQVTNIGCGLAGYNPKQIAPMFIDSPSNCFFSKEFTDIINETTKTKHIG